MLRIKLRKTDKLYTRLIRFKYDYTCQACGRKYSAYNTVKLANLGVSHYFGRGKESTRFDDNNVTLACNLPCHRKWETEKRGEYVEYMLERLGLEGLQELELKSNQYKKRNDAEDEEMLKNRLLKAGLKEM